MESTLHYTSVSHADSLMSSINRMRLDADQCDVAVVVGKFRIKAHRIILSASAPFFYQLFHSDPTKSTRVLPEYYLDNVDETAALKIIEFCYTSTISLDADNVWPLFSAAVKFECKEISNLCSDFLTSELNVSTCLHTIHMAAQIGNLRLLSSVGQYIAEHVQEVADSPTLLALTTSEVVQVISSLLQLSLQDQEFVRLAKVWLDHNKDLGQQVAFQLLEKFPSHSEELQKYINPELISGIHPGKTTEGAESRHKLTSQRQFHSDAASTERLPGSDIGRTNRQGSDCPVEVSRDVPLYICVSCGDAFDDQQQVVQHQEVCDESVQPVTRKKETKSHDDQRTSLPDHEFEDVVKHDRNQTTDSFNEVYRKLDRKSQGKSKKSELMSSSIVKDEINRFYGRKDLGTNASRFPQDSLSLSVVSMSESKPLNSSFSSPQYSCHSLVQLRDKSGKFGESPGAVNCPENVSPGQQFDRDLTKHNETEDHIGDNTASVQQAKDTTGGQDFDQTSRFDQWSTSNVLSVLSGVTHSSEGSAGLAQISHNDANNNDIQTSGHGSPASGSSSHASHQGQVKENQNSHSSDLNFNPNTDSQKKNINHFDLDKSYVGGERNNEMSPGIDVVSNCEKNSDDDCDVSGKCAHFQSHFSSPASSLKQNRMNGKSELTWHRNETRTDNLSLETILSLRCQICGQSFTSRKTLAGHWRVVHGLDQHTATSDTVGGDVVVGVAHDEVVQEKGGDDISNKKAKKESNDLHQGDPSTNGGRIAHNDLEPMRSPHDVENKKKEISSLPGDHLSLSGDSVPSEFSDLMNHYLQQYHQFTKWYLQQGPVFCQLCLICHPKGSCCPKSSLVTRDGDKTEVIGDEKETEKDSGYCQNLSDCVSFSETDGPLDMSKSSQEFASSFHTNPARGQSDLMMTSPVDLPQYYTNYARFVAAAVSAGSRDGNLSLPYPDVLSQLGPIDLSSESKYTSNLQAPPSFPLNFTLDSDLGDKERKSSQREKSDAGLASCNTDGNLSSSAKRKVSRQGFPCTVCHRVFSYQAALFTHMRTHSPSARTYECQLCQQSFARAPDLKVHVCPNGVEKPYTCPSCGQTFAKNIHLKRHLATHSGLKPYPCWVCGKRFSRSDHLKRHTQSIHAGSRPHGCHVCGKEFVRKYELNKHMLVHSVELPNGPFTNGQVTTDIKP